LERYPDYQSLTTPPSGLSGSKSAPTEKLYFHFVQDPQTRVSGLRAGTYDIADSIPTEDYAALSSDGALKLYQKNSGALTAFFNTRSGLMASLPMRQAVLASINDNDILMAAFANPALYSLNPGYLNPQQTQWATDAGLEYYNQNNPQKASELLKEAGYVGETLTILATPDYAEMFNATVVLHSQLEKAGIKARIDPYDFSTFMERKNNYALWDIFLASTVYQMTPPQLLALSPDFAGFDNEEAKTLIKAIRRAPNQEEAKAQWEKLQEFMYSFGSGTVLGHYVSLVGTNAKVFGFEAFIAPVVWNAKIAK
ncbi:MAG: ABC transporter substrate-binding protein, partial [Deltaproteobacteria bacterium]|jgi:peptide/nickel transport system substrate-binding protein|nr:ABC transporter substrate-binding protein [Deltaproteobacteria bacterium]